MTTCKNYVTNYIGTPIYISENARDLHKISRILAAW